MTRQLFFNVSGDPRKDAPWCEPDAPEGAPPIPLQFQPGATPPNRAMVDVPSQYTGGATVWFQNSVKSFRVILPPLGEEIQAEAGQPPQLPPEYNGDASKVALAYVWDLPRPVWDGTYLRFADGRRYVARHITGFLDYKLWLDGGAAALGPVLRQSQDLGVRGRRVLPHIVNITNFNPDDYGERYWQELPGYLDFNLEYGQEVDFPVLSDTQYRGWPLGKCQDFWNRFCATVLNCCWLSLTNEYDHGGNLVGTPNDYNRPNDPIVSQGSAVSDAPPPRPGWGSREFHVQKPFPKIGLCEDMYFNRIGFDADGKQWGPVLPTRLTEICRFNEDPNAYNPWLANCLAYQSMAYGDGMTFHCEDGKYSRLLAPNQARCCASAMAVLASAEMHVSRKGHHHGR